MAILNKSVLGKVSGSVGDITFRQRNGKNYISLKSNSYSAPDTEAFQLRKNTFTVSAKSAANIVSDATLFNIWNILTPSNMSVYNYLIKVNYPLFNSAKLSTSNMITPEDGFNFGVTSASLTDTEFTLETAALSGSPILNSSNDKQAMLFLLLGFTGLAAGGDGLYFKMLTSEIGALDLAAPLSYSLALDDLSKERYSEFQNRNGLYALVTFDDMGVTSNYSVSKFV